MTEDVNVKIGRDKVPPQALDAERAVLGGILLEAEAATKAIEIVSPDDFYRPAHGMMFKAMITLFMRREPIDVMTLTEELRKTDELELLGGAAAATPVAGEGIAALSQALRFNSLEVRPVGDDVYIRGRRESGMR